MSIKLTKGNISDLNTVEYLSKNLTGKLFGDKGYISKDLAARLHARGLRLFTGIRKDMKNHLMKTEDKINLHKRSLVESVFNVLKNNMNLEHTRHRFLLNYFVHLLASITSYVISKANNINNLFNFKSYGLSRVRVSKLRHIKTKWVQG
jgi:hypothetical protein